MEKKEYMEKRLNKYKEALGKCFTHEASILSPDQFKDRLSDMGNGDTLNYQHGYSCYVCLQRVG